SYAELEARANRLAHHLRALGVGPEVPVGVLLPRTPDLVVALLGVLKAGGAYVPLDPAYPPERVAYVLGDTRVPVLLTDSALAAPPAGAAATVRVDTERARIDALPSSPPAVAVHPEGLAYVIYTSGSTGRPKGVQIEHRSTVAVLRWLRRTLSDAERAAVLGSTSVCFDVSIAEVFGTLCWGGTLVLVENALSLAGLGEPVATACMVPSAAAELLRLGGIPPGVRTLALGGEPLRGDLAQRLYALGHVERVLNLYGPTEDTTYSTCKEPERGSAAAMTVGRAVDGTTVRVLDAELAAAAPGEAGEVWMAGAGLARGYLGAPGMTAERFRPDPFAAAPGARMYRTGDLGRLLPDGELECLGRIDNQVKVRGYRVEPGEVESALLAHPAVREAAVAPWDDARGRRLAAWVAVDGAAPPAAELREAVRSRLPDYMVPDAVVFLPALPHTPNGKVDRLALPAPDPARDASAAYAAPSTAVQAALAEIWAEVLGVERVGVEDDFFALGGHSLRATQIAARVRERLGAELPLSTLFAMPTVRELAQLVDGAGTQGAGGIPRAPRDGPLPLSFPQEAIWFFQQLAPGMRSYNFQATVRIRGALGVEALEGTLSEIVRRHEIFRTTFPAMEGAPVQVVHAPWTVRLPVVDLGTLPAAEREAELEARLAEEFRRPFDLAALPLARWTLFRLSGAEHVLLCVEQHLVHDGWSFGVFLRELTEIYPAFLRGEPSPLAEPPIQYADFAVWQREWMASPDAREQLDWWRRRLQGVPPVLELPADRPRPAAMSFRGHGYRLRLPAELYRAADEYSRARGVTVFMTLFAAFQALLHRYTGAEDFCVGSGVAGRRMREAEDLIGMVVNTIPIRADLGGDPAFEELVGRVRDASVDAYAHQEVPFARIVEAVHPERSRGHLPVFQVAFSFHHAPYPELRLPGATLAVEEGLGNESAKFDLNVVVIPRAQQGAGDADEVVMIWEWAEDLFDPSTVRRMVDHFETLLADALADPGARVSRLRLLPDAEERAAVRAGDATAPYPRHATLHGLFAEQVRRAPHAVAVEHGARTLTYAELDAASERLAARLLALGVAAESRVGVAMNRSLELAVGLLAVAKAGATYVPLDPAYPAERLAYMLADSRASVVVVRDEVPASLRGYAGPLVSLAEPGAAAGTAAPTPAPAHPDSLACVFYTSGSTGTPKGIALPHRGLVRLVREADYLQLGPEHRVGQTSAVSFDVALWELWGPLLNGGRVVVLDRETLLSPPALGEVVREKGINAMFLTTALFRQIALEAPEIFAPVEHLLTGGEAADPAAFAAVLESGFRGRLINMYGPGEASTYASWHPVERVAPGAPIPIGAPIANTRLYVLDAAMRPVPAGVAGELYVGGDGLARGYLDRPGLTAERFVPDPLSGEPGARLYRSGDRVRRLAAGPLEFVGRVDHQVKVRGFRVEPGEVEAALRAHPAVADAAVVPRQESSGDHYLAAYVVGAEGAAPAAAELREFLAARLPPFMVPSAFVAMEALPLSPAGKVDRRALPDPAAAAAGEAAAPPETPTEAEVAEIWREVLEVERVGVGDNFFDLGGHSLRATRILSRVQSRLGVRLTVASLFDHPTVRDMAGMVDEHRTARVDDSALLAWVEGLSDEEAERLLAEGAAGTG
ncbi:MAG TPA: amino acid adenylation domain-containing protein, partial [Longimicrobiaceae bacterium]|nr:amino acid adenylation domain-containing protein [Longimicrobiaceae bacterium]